MLAKDQVINTYRALNNWRSFRLKLFIEGIIIGILSGLIISFFRWSLHLVETNREHIYTFLKNTDWYWTAFWFIALAVIAFTLDRLTKYEPLAAGSGIPQVKGAILGFIKMRWLRILWVKLLAGIIGIGAGLSLGLLDPCFIFGVGFFPKWGVTGAAVATCIGQFTAAAFGLFFNMKFNKEITINLVKYRPQAKIIKKIYAVGLPSIIMQSISSIMTYGMNKILIGFSNTAAAVFGVYFKLQSFVFMPVFGLNNGLIPIVAYNYGARKKKRITGAIKYAMIYSVSIMIVGTIIMQIFPAQLLKLFDASDNMLSIGVTALRIISTHFFFAGFDIIIISSLQALGRGLSSMLVSFTRQLVVLLPVAYLLSLTGKLDAIWWAFPIAEIFSIMASLFFLRRAYNAEIKPMAD